MKNIRETAFHLLEYGSGWFYLTQDSDAAGTAKLQLRSLMIALKTQIEALNSEMIFACSLTNSDKLMLKIEEIETLENKIIQAFEKFPQEAKKF